MLKLAISHLQSAKWPDQFFLANSSSIALCRIPLSNVKKDHKTFDLDLKEAWTEQCKPFVVEFRRLLSYCKPSLNVTKSKHQVGNIREEGGGAMYFSSLNIFSTTIQSCRNHS